MKGVCCIRGLIAALQLIAPVFVNGEVDLAGTLGVVKEENCSG
jgi:hypothetical protein